MSRELGEYTEFDCACDIRDALVRIADALDVLAGPERARLAEMAAEKKSKEDFAAEHNMTVPEVEEMDRKLTAALRGDGNKG